MGKIDGFLRYIKSAFGVIGILGGMYGSSLQAKFGITGKVFGDKALEISNSITSTIGDWLPYFTFAFCATCGVLWIVSICYHKFHKDKKSSKTEYITTIEKSMLEISKALEKLKNSNNH